MLTKYIYIIDVQTLGSLVNLIQQEGADDGLFPHGIPLVWRNCVGPNFSAALTIFSGSMGIADSKICIEMMSEI
jgi:hypothetical protein